MFAITEHCVCTEDREYGFRMAGKLQYLINLVMDVIVSEFYLE